MSRISLIIIDPFLSSIFANVVGSAAIVGKEIILQLKAKLSCKRYLTYLIITVHNFCVILSYYS